MKFIEIKKEAKKYQSAIKFNDIFNQHRRFLIARFLCLGMLFLLFFTLYKSNFLKDSLEKIINFNFSFSWNLIKDFIFNHSWVLKLFLILLVFWLALKMARMYLFSKIFDRGLLDFELLKYIYHSLNSEDLVKSLFETDFGEEMGRRMYLDQKNLAKFLKEKKNIIFDDEENIYFNQSEIQRIEHKITIVDFLNEIYKLDKEFQRFLLRKNIKKKDFLDVASWIYRKKFHYKNKKRWWSLERLFSFGQFGVALSYGKLFFLDKFAWDISYYQGFFGENAYEVYETDIKKIENVLVKSNNRNLFLVSESDSSSFELLKLLSHRLSIGDLGSEFEELRVKVLPSLMLFEQNKGNFENIFISILNEATNAGNIAIVFEDFFALYTATQKYGIDVLALMKNYFNSDTVFIILTKKNIYENFLQNNSYLKDYFDTILSYHDFEEGFLFLMQEAVLKMEGRNKFFISYKAMVYLVGTIKRFYPEKSLPETFIKILKDFMIDSKRNGYDILNLKMAKKFIEFKTGIPQTIDDNLDKVLSLEEKIKEKIIGQDLAVKTITDAIKRSRAGLDDKDKPISSFLFIGPTGVGKTETAKVLAELYFASRDKMIRFDMSEYSKAEAMAELIGSTYTNKIGSLSKVVNANPYSLILFDELEKANREVHDLFLQILDEGQLTDAFGTKLDFRNSIIIATSNAGSELMYQSEYSDFNKKEAKDLIINYIIQNKIFRPEFLNRFTKTVLFNKLGIEEMKKIVGLQLKYLVQKLWDQSYEFLITEELEEYLAKKAGITNFGARETKRIIKEDLESFIADKILERKINIGDKFKIDIIDEQMEVIILE